MEVCSVPRWRLIALVRALVELGVLEADREGAQRLVAEGA
jgi:hypothetical protein